LIQRDYTDIEEYYLYREGDEESEGADADAEDGTEDEQVEAVEDDERQIFHTSAGRKGFGGGGIRPDYVVKADRAPQLLARLVRDNLVFDYAVRYNNANDELDEDFQIDDETFADFRNYLHEREFSFSDEELNTGRDAIALRLRAQIARVRWNQAAESRILMEADVQVQRALELLDEAAELARRTFRPAKRSPKDLRAEAREHSTD
jgi:carboxyl-terminal processing protease